METPLPMRRITRSQASLASQNRKHHDGGEKPSASWSRTHRSVLLDITNDSPIVGLATGNEKTPSSSVSKNKTWRGKAVAAGTPGSGEALLRCQVRTLLQKVEEEAELVKPSSEEAPGFRALLGHLRSPAALLAPTPANTPLVICPPGNKEGPTSATPSAQKDDDSGVPVAAAMPKDEEETPDPNGQLISRALKFDSPEESEISNSSTLSSAVTYQGSDLSGCPDKSEDDCSSVWSVQVNPSSREDDEDGGEDDDCGGVGGEFGAAAAVDVVDGWYYEGDEEETEAEEEGLDALCEGLRMMSMAHEKVGLPEFAGKHTRFTYNSDDEIVGEEEVGGGGGGGAAAAAAAVVSPSVVQLRGLPVPEGKHLRFPEEQEE